MGISTEVENRVSRDNLASAIENKFGEYVAVFQNVRCPDPFNPKEVHCFPVVVLTELGIYPFVEVVSDFNGSEVLETVDYKLRVFADCFHVQSDLPTNLVLQPVEEKESDDTTERLMSGQSGVVYRLFCCQASAFGGVVIRPQTSSDAVDSLEEIFLCSAGTAILSEQEIKSFTNKLLKYSLETSKGSDPLTPVFEQDPENTFYLALLGGFLGVHRFRLKLYGTGILYLFTFGLMGIGWFFDCLEILLGVWKKKNKKLLPLNNRKKHVFEFAGVFTVLFALLIVLAKFL